MESRGQTHVPCICRRILNHWSTREVLCLTFWETTRLFSIVSVPPTFFLRFVYFCLCWIFLVARRLSSVADWGAVGLLIVCFSCCRARAPGPEASAVAGPWLSSCSPWALKHRLSSCGPWAWGCGVLLDQGSNSRLLHWWKVDSSPLSHQGGPHFKVSIKQEMAWFPKRWPIYYMRN